MVDDFELLRRYVDQHDQQAFAQIVRRHVNAVFSAAARQVGERQLAEDITQAVFVVLARKSARLCRRNAGTLSGWLLNCVRYASANALKMRKRRIRHEQAAGACFRSGACSPDPSEVLLWQEISQQLDCAVLKLPAQYRQAILLRYFEDRSISQIAQRLNMSEGAAKQRLSRALGKLRQRVSRDSAAMMSSIDSSAFASLLAAHAVRMAPAGLANSAIAAAMGGATAAAGLSIAKGAMTMMAWTKAKVAAVVIAALVVGGAGGVIAVRNATAADRTAAAPSDKPAAQHRQNEVSVETAPPVVVKTEPQAGATDVDPGITEIKVTYSKAMMDGSWSWSTWGLDTFPKMTGPPHYEADQRTCVARVKLEPGHTYAMWLNSNKYGNFRDAEGRKAVPYLLIFETRK